MMTMRNEVSAEIERIGVVPVMVIHDPADASHVAAALVEGGLPCAEVTLRTPGALESLRRITAENPEILAGAGTVLNETQARNARDAGARFIVSPGFSRRVVDYCNENSIPVFPGVATSSEITAALDAGADTLKFFPAEAMGGVTTLKALSAAFGDVKFIPTGGIDENNLRSYLSLPNVIACGGSWMAPSEWIAARQFDRIREAGREVAALISSHRSAICP